MAERPTEPRLAAKLILALLGLAGMLYLVWPRSPVIERSQPSAAGSTWQIEQGRALLSGPTMGTSFNVVLVGEQFDQQQLAELQAAIDAELQAVNDEMSTYQADSELSRFNASPAQQDFQASPHLFEIVALAQQIGEQSGGAFDVTVGPLVDAWGFGPGDRELRVLSEQELAELREVVGHDKLILDRAKQTLRKTVPGLRVDLSAIAKGHGCDRVAALLEAGGWQNYMVEIGGEVWARGSNPKGEPWKVGVERPTADASGSRVVQAVVGVRDAGVATSGDYRNYWERDGVRYSHTLDPRTGRPVVHELASVTVVHPESAALADAWATALNVLGTAEGLALAEQRGLAAYFVVRTEAGFAVRSSSAFAPYLP